MMIIKVNTQFSMKCFIFNRINQYMFFFQCGPLVIQTIKLIDQQNATCLAMVVCIYVTGTCTYIYNGQHRYLLISHHIYLVYQVVICSNSTGDTQHVD